MQYAQCRCGAVVRWDTGDAIHDCQGCERCQTTLARNPDGHKELQPHTPKPQYDRDDGRLSHYICTVCCARCDEQGTGLG